MVLARSLREAGAQHVAVTHDGTNAAKEHSTGSPSEVTAWQRAELLRLRTLGKPTQPRGWALTFPYGFDVER